LKQQGYATACIGKWHVGMDLPRLEKPARTGDGWGIDWQGVIRNGPVAVGFDRYFGITASLDMPPYVWIRDDRFTAPATTDKAFFRKGAAAADFEAVDVLGRLTDEAVAHIKAQADGAKQGKPFFLYLPLTSPHTPIVPAKEWQGKSGISPYGDFVMQTDACVGQVLDALDQAGVGRDTLVVLTSDNGCSPAAKIDDLEAKGHFASADRRGYKADIWDGGHRIPFICRWPARVKAGSVSDQLTCLTDLMATCADLTGAQMPAGAGEDSVSMLPALIGTATAPLREAVVHHSIDGRFAIRQSRWKLELCPGSGGWAKPRDDAARTQGLPEVQLYDMATDAGEQRNQQAEQPEVVKTLTTLLERYVAEGRSTPGPAQRNDVAVDPWKKGKEGKRKAKGRNEGGKE
jgi:arylsulfatase A-like enzyme